MWCAASMRAGKIRAQPLTGPQLMNFDQWSAVAPTAPCKPTERALDLIDDDTDATEVGFDVLLRQNKVLRTIGADDRINACGIGLTKAKKMKSRINSRIGYPQL